MNSCRGVSAVMLVKRVRWMFSVLKHGKFLTKKLLENIGRFMPKKKKNHSFSRRNTMLSRQHVVKTSSLSCPLCNQRIPLFGINKHYMEAHRSRHIEASKVKSISYIPVTRGKHSPILVVKKVAGPSLVDYLALEREGSVIYF